MLAPMEAPRDEDELLDRARALGGRTFVEVARELEVPLPPDPRRAKGFVGQLVERALGGACDSAPRPDFPRLGIELKTLPIDARGRVRESTFVCSTPLGDAAETEWVASRVRHKLGRVLWLTLEADPSVSHGRRRFGAAFLWSPDLREEALLREDWTELMGLIGAGAVETIDATRGQVLQLRPKGANASQRTVAYDADGAPFLAPPRGFYLRARFTACLLERAGLWVRA